VRSRRAPTSGARRTGPLVALVGVLIVVLAAGGVGASIWLGTSARVAGAPTPPATMEDVGGPLRPVVPPTSPAVTEARPAPPRGEPTRVTIPAIGVDVALVPLGLRSDGAMVVPDFGLAGWYSEGPRPGHPGPSVVAAHVDSRRGPDVFGELSQLVAGDRVHILFDSGDRTTFVVTSSERTPKVALPLERIWPLTTERLLALITCGGEFDPAAGRYVDNVIVYAIELGEWERRTAGD